MNAVKENLIRDIRWHFRRRFWDWFALLKFRHNKPTRVPVPTGGQPLVGQVPLVCKFRGIPISQITVADHVPRDEAQPLKLWLTRFQTLMYRVYPATLPESPPISNDPDRALAIAYTPAHRRCFARPRRPPDYERGIDLGQLAVASPYACYLKEDGKGRFQWDLRFDELECHPGLRRPAAVVEFEVDQQEARLRAVGIESDRGWSHPSDPDWRSAQRLALCAATTHLSLVRHFNWIHLVGGAQMAMITRNCLPAKHSVRRLLWPHIYGTQYSNEVVTLGQMVEGGDFESIFSFTHRDMCKLFEATAGGFDLRLINPSCDAERRGIVDAGFDTPALENRLALMNVLGNHALRYLTRYFEDDDALAEDEPFMQWCDELERRLPHGIGKLLSGGKVTLEDAAKLLSTLIYLVTVEHEIVGSGLWNYQLWSDVNPVRVYRDGSRRERLDVYQRLVNADFVLNVRRLPLLSDFSDLALDAKGAEVFVQFRDDLHALQAELDRHPAECWRIEPRILKANINA